MSAEHKPKCSQCYKKLQTDHKLNKFKCDKKNRKQVEMSSYDFFDLYEQNHNILLQMKEEANKYLKNGSSIAISNENPIVHNLKEPVLLKKIFNHREYDDLKVQKGFNCLDFPYFFINQTDCYSCPDSSFTTFHIINLRTKKYLAR